MKATQEVLLTILKNRDLRKDLHSLTQQTDKDRIFSGLREFIYYTLKNTIDEKITDKIRKKVDGFLFSSLVQEQFIEVYSANIIVKTIDELIHYRNNLSKTIIPEKYTIRTDDDDEGDEVENTKKLQFLVVGTGKRKGIPFKVCSLNNLSIYYIYENNN
jgi:hypothetical protein